VHIIENMIIIVIICNVTWLKVGRWWVYYNYRLVMWVYCYFRLVLSVCYVCYIDVFCWYKNKNVNIKFSAHGAFLG